MPADLPLRDAVRVLDFDDDLSRVYPFSTETTLWVGHGFRVDGGWSRETLEIDVESGEVRKRTPLDTWHGAVDILRPTIGRRAFCYHGDSGGVIFVRDLTTGQVLKTLRSPFHDLREGDDALLVRNLSDIAVSGDGNWILAFTPDGTLHSINTKTGAYTVEWRYPDAVGREFIGSRDLLALRGTNRFLLEDDSDEDPVLRIWDQDSRTMAEVERVPFRSWKGGRGDVAWQSANREPTVWDLRRREELELPGGTSGAIRFELSREARILFMMRRDGTIIVYRLATRTPIARLTPPVERSEKDEGWSRLDMTLSADDALLFWQYDRSRGDDERATIAIFDVADL